MPIAPEYLHMVFPSVTFDALLYGRASRDPKKKGRSVADQISTGREMCDDYNWPIAEVFDQDIDRSASRHAKRKRRDFEALIDAIEAGRGKIVVAFEASRYYRDIEAYIRLRNACMANNVLLCYNGQVYDLSKREDRKATAQDAIAAEDEAEGIRERNMRTSRLQAKKGAPHGKCPWGYARRYDPDTGDLVDQYGHPERARVVADVFDRVAAGEAPYSVMMDLRSCGEREPGRRWEMHHVRDMLRNPAYIGKRVHRGEIVGDATWKALVDEDVFWAVQRILDDPERRKSNDNAVTHWLSWIALCGECGAAGDGDEPHLKAQPSRGAMAYECSERHDTVMREALLDAYVEEALIEWLSKPEAADAFRDDAQQKRASAAKARMEVLERQLADARSKAGELDAQGNPRLSISSLVDIEGRLLPQIEEARAVTAVATAPPVVKGLLGQPDIEDRWENLTMAQRRAVVRAVVTVRLFKARVRGVRRIEPGRIQLSFVGEPGFKRRRVLRAPAAKQSPDAASGPVDG
ncbi:recombinase family protein [Streptomyces sp. B15]|uniref:recombinase family protein n=1 Tax=Streptomyces sp. B15 TaxID=1537797 RepID=UPI001B365C3A|nr:recombinase family protein [Streptomyces sp. B15]MBQ1122582.1 recombinase family protein [Streptomyces sp. B15]